MLSFDLQAFAGVFIAVGTALFLYVEAPRPRGIGQTLLAFGFMLLGMGLLGAAARELGSDPAVINLFAALGQLPVLFLIGAALLTLLMQSATASIALALALVASGAILFAAVLGRWVRVLVPEPAAAEPSGATSLDPLLLQNPALALNAVLRETLQVFDHLHLMREKTMLALSEGALPAGLKAEMERRRRHLLDACDELVEFLDAIPDDALDEEDQILKETLDDFMRELPIIVRTLGPDLYGEVERLLREHPDKAASARPLLVEAAARLSQQMNTVARMLMRERPEFGRSVRPGIVRAEPGSRDCPSMRFATGNQISQAGSGCHSGAFRACTRSR